MPSKSPNRGISLYNPMDSQTKFLTFRENLAGDSDSSAMMILDKWSGEVDKKITEIEKINPNVLVNATWISQGYYETTTTEITEYRDNLIIAFRPNVDNDGTTTLKINNLDIKTLMKYDNLGMVTNLDVKDLRANHEYQFRYDGTRWVWQGGNSADQINIVGDSNNIVMIDINNNLIDSGIDNNDIVMKAQIKNNLTEITTGNTLDASQGKILDGKIGVLSELVTTNKDSLVSAVNENVDKINDCLIKRALNTINVDNERNSYIAPTSEHGHIIDAPYKDAWTNYVQFDSLHFLTQLAFLQTPQPGFRVRKKYSGDASFGQWFDVPMCARPTRLPLLNLWEGNLMVVDTSTYMHVFGRITSGINTANTVICSLPSTICQVSYETVFDPWGNNATSLLFFGNGISIFSNPHNASDLNINVLIQKSL